jgi:hypothetical protein
MPIPESQLDTWSHQGSVPQSRDTYATVKLALEASDAPHASKDFKVFLQGSYCNDTNIYSESDVDVVIRLDSIYYPDLSQLTPEQKAAYEAARHPVSYTLEQFKQDVLTTLQKRFGSGVKGGKKAIAIDASGNRRKADVIVAAMNKKFHEYPVKTTPPTEGILFLTDAGTRIINYPTLHSENCTRKHQSTASWFKPAVRILKNMRKRLVDSGTIASGVAPSYFIEGLLYNVPDGNFGGTYQVTIAKALDWIVKAKRDDLVCANRQYYLVRDYPNVCWKPADADQFISAAVHLWNSWP